MRYFKRERTSNGNSTRIRGPLLPRKFVSNDPFTLVNQAFKNLYRTNKGSLAVDKPATGYRISFEQFKLNWGAISIFGVIFASVHERSRFLLRLNLKLPQKFISCNFIDVSNLKWA